MYCSYIPFCSAVAHKVLQKKHLFLGWTDFGFLHGTVVKNEPGERSRCSDSLRVGRPGDRIPVVARFLRISPYNTFRIMCDVPSIAVFCSESIECFPGTASKFFFKLFVIIPVAPIITGAIVHFKFHIRCISINKLLYFNFFSAYFCTTFLSAGIVTSISVNTLSFLILIIISGLFAVTSLSVCTAWFHNTVTSPSSYTGFGMCVFHYHYYYYYWDHILQQIICRVQFKFLIVACFQLFTDKP